MLGKKYDNSFDKMMARNKITVKIGSISYSNNDISSLIIFNENGKNIYSDIDSSTAAKMLGENFENSEIYKKVKEAGGNPVWITGIKSNYDKVFMMRKLNGFSNSNNSGVLVYIISTDVLLDIIEGAEFDEDSSVQLFTENRTVITALNEEKIGQKYQGYINKEKDNNYQSDKGMLIAYSTINNGWRISSSIPMYTLMVDIYELGKRTIILAVICAVILGLYISLGISNPLYKIMHLMSSVAYGDLTVSSNLNGKNELGSLAKSFNEMIKNIRQLINNTSNASNIAET